MKSRYRGLFSLLLMAGWIAWLVEPGQAITNTWVGTNYANWDEAANWTPAGPPGSNDVAYLPDNIVNNYNITIRYPTTVGGIAAYANNQTRTLGVAGSGSLQVGTNGIDFICDSGGNSSRYLQISPPMTGAVMVVSRNNSINPYVGSIAATINFNGSLSNVTSVTLNAPSYGLAGLVGFPFGAGYTPPTNSILVNSGAYAMRNTAVIFSNSYFSFFNTQSAGVLLMRANQNGLDLSNHTNLIVGAYGDLTLSGTVALAASAPYRFGGTVKAADPRYDLGSLTVTADLNGDHELIVDSGAASILTGTIILNGNNNTYRGATTVRGTRGILSVWSPYGLGQSRLVNIEAGATLALTNAVSQAIHPRATLNLFSSGTSTGKVAFGTNTLNQVVAVLSTNGVVKASGLYTSNSLPNWITGAGSIEVVPLRAGTTFSIK